MATLSELRSTVASIRGEVESFGSGVAGRIEPARAELKTLAQGVKDTIATIRPEIESTVKKLTGQIDALEKELQALKP